MIHMKPRLLIYMVVAFVGAQLNAGLLTTSRLAEAIVPACFIAKGCWVYPDDKLVVYAGVLGLSMVGMRMYVDSRQLNLSKLKIGTKSIQVLIPALFGLWNIKEMVFVSEYEHCQSCENKDSCDRCWINKQKLLFMENMAAMLAEAAIQICC